MIEGLVSRIIRSELKTTHLYEKMLKWQETTCHHCGAKVKYSPRPGFKGKLYCGSCGKFFYITQLDQFVGEDE